MIKSSVSLMFFIVFGFQAFTQESLKGQVIDKESAAPLFGAVIAFKNTDFGTTTNDLGAFKLELSSSPDTIVVSYTGYVSKVIPIFKNDFLNITLQPVTISICLVTLESTPILVNLPAPIMQFGKQEIERENSLRLDPILNKSPGVYMHSGALNTNRITIRGIGNRSPFSTKKIRAYLDDIPLTNGDGETNLEDLELNFINKIKVWKGPTASIYGAGLGGLLHLQTEELKERSTSYISHELGIGSFALLRNVTQAYLKDKRGKASLDITFSDTNSDGYRENNDYKRTTFSVFGKYKFNKNHQTSFLFNATDLFAEIPSSLNRIDFQNEAQKAGGNWGIINGKEAYNKLLSGISHQAKISKIGSYDFSNNTSISYTRKTGNEIRPFNVLRDESDVYSLRSVFHLNKGYKKIFSDFSLGFEWFREEYKWQTLESEEGIAGSLLSDNISFRNYSNLFVQSYKLLTKNISLLAGINVNTTMFKYKDRFSIDGTDDSGDYTFKTIASPKLGLNYAFQNEQSLFVSLSHGFSPPSNEETFTPDGEINPEIQPESGWNYEIGSRGKLFSKLDYEVTIYQMRVKDLLQTERISEDQFIGINAGETRHNGLEAFLAYRFSNKPNEITSFLSYTYSDYTFVDFENNGEDYSGNALTGAPPHHLNIGMDAKTKFGFYGNMNFQYVDAFPMRDDNAIYSEAYKLFNLKLGFSKSFDFMKKEKSFELNTYLGIRNVLNEKYASMILINASSFGANLPRYYYPGLPRNFYGGVKFIIKI